jgi:hypothetical protein
MPESFNRASRVPISANCLYGAGFPLAVPRLHWSLAARMRDNRGTDIPQNLLDRT